MTGFAFAIPGDIELATGGYGYDRRVMAEWRAAGHAFDHVVLPGGFPFPTSDELATATRRLDELPPGRPVLIDGLALGALPADLLRRLGRPVVALVHHPLALETGLDDRRRSSLLASERAALAETVAVIATSASTARIVEEDYGVAPGRVTVAEPGTDRRPRAHGSGRPARLLSVGAVIPRKAHGALVEALARLSALDWTCHIVGPIDRDADEVRAVERRIASLGLGDRIVLTGAISEAALAREFDAADLYVSASLFEGYGMALAEALAHGLAIVATRAGAIPHTVPPEAAVLTTPGDVDGLAEAIRTLLTRPDRRRQLADHAWRHAQSLPTWAQTAATILQPLREAGR
ncbi:glycosyltransferase family 1 protein [Siculibacillus lacustris]|uniref:Glycosyltransferase family 1 protein n=1 Tax=Siculibacillus lacustris TaxID=1549641 RepID=A0A4Q9VSL7_9HYPH|nr:glycosyltransferase family 4 protein [Siculibacillus lacustris]TBW38984.1 glycosyltransferase family 1 protein [Siculibacillus lacustris]